MRTSVYAERLQVFDNSTCIFLWLYSRSRPRPPQCWGFTITLSYTTLGKTPLDEWSARRKYLFLTTHNNYNRQSSMPQRDSNPQSQTHALGRAAAGIGLV